MLKTPVRAAVAIMTDCIHKHTVEHFPDPVGGFWGYLIEQEAASNMVVDDFGGNLFQLPDNNKLLCQSIINLRIRGLILAVLFRDRLPSSSAGQQGPKMLRR